jgi:hypothetical protein
MAADSSAAPDAGDGSPPSNESTDPVEAEVAGDAGDGAGPDDDDSDDDDYSDVPFNEHPRFKALTRKLSKQRKQLAKFRPVAERVKDLNVDELSMKARAGDQLQEVLARSPKLREQFMKAMAEPEAGDAPEPEFDPSKLPFDVSDDSGKFFAGFYKEFLEMKKQQAALQSHVRRTGESSAAETRARDSRLWKQATAAAEAQVPEPYREMFHDAVYSAFRDARERNVRIDPQRVIDHYLKKMGGNKGNQSKASLAAAQRIAEGNKQLPRQPQHPGTGATAKGDRKETVADVNRRLKRMYAR